MVTECDNVKEIRELLDAVKLNEGVDILDGKELGRGSYGRVFTVRYGGLRYAAKEIHPILYELGVGPKVQQKIKESFYRECYYCSKLRHPNIVQFIGVYYPSDAPVCSIRLPVMVMELMDCSLTSFIEKKVTAAVDMTVKHSILLDVAHGLKYLHGQNPPILHRDLSPNNIMMSSHDSQHVVAKIGDLGVAKVIARADTKSKLTSVPGTADFMPPEAIHDNPVYDTSLDVFSFGGIILYVITEEWPTPKAPTEFDNVTRSTVGFSEAERRQHYLDKMTGKASDSVKSLVERCLDNDRSMRPTMAAATKLLMELPSLMPALQNENCHIEWRKCPDLPYKMRSVSVATNNAKSKVYIVPKNNSLKDGGTSCFCYDISLKQWKVLPEMGHYYCTLLLCNGHLNIIGGYDSNTHKFSPKVLTFLEATNSWVTIYPDMSKARVKPGVAEYHNHMIVAGGCIGKRCLTNDIEILDCEQKPLLWKRCAVQLPVKMWSINLAVGEDYIYIVGYSSTERTSGNAYRIPAGAVLISLLNPTKPYAGQNQWIPLPVAPYIRASVVCIGSCLMIAGGSKLSEVTSDILSFDGIDHGWKKIGTLSSPRADVAVCALGDTTLMAIGGYSKGGGLEASENSSLSTVEIGQVEFNSIKTDESFALVDCDGDSEPTTNTNDPEADEKEQSPVHNFEVSTAPPLPMRPCYENVNKLNDKSPPPLPWRPSYENVRKIQSVTRSISFHNDSPVPSRPPIKPRNLKNIKSVKRSTSLTDADFPTKSPPAIPPKKIQSVKRSISLLTGDDPSATSRPAIPSRVKLGDVSRNLSGSMPCLKDIQQDGMKEQGCNSCFSWDLTYPPRIRNFSSKFDSPILTSFKANSQDDTESNGTQEEFYSNCTHGQALLM